MHPNKLLDFSVLDRPFFGRLPLVHLETQKEIGEIILGIVTEEDLEINKRFGLYIPPNWHPPFGVVRKIYVYPQWRRKGFGRASLELIDEFFIRKKISSTIMSVTWSQDIEEDPLLQLNWRVKLYQFAGWKLVENFDELNPILVKFYE